LNPAHFGAAIVLDARYLNFANNDPIDAWPSRTNTHTYSGTSTARPTFKTNISGGQPMVLSASPNRLTSTLTNFLTSTNVSLTSTMLIGSSTNSGGQVALAIRSTTANREFLMFNQSGTSFWGFRNGTNGRQWPRPAANVIAIETLNNDTPKINGVAQSIVAHTHGGNGQTNSVCAAAQAATSFVGNLGQICVFDFAVSEDAMKRLRHAGAFSFKIACS
jgi:hypothetical protein